MKNLTITREQFEAYEKVRESGVTNMFDRRRVIEYMDDLYEVSLSKEQYLELIRNYAQLKAKYNN